MKKMMRKSRTFTLLAVLLFITAPLTAGVAIMGQAHGVYTFFAHLKWTWAITFGYAASIWLHLLINSPVAA